MMIELRALGAAEIRIESTTLTPTQTVVFAAALYLIIERDKLITRDRLAAMIWPSGTAGLRAHRLRQTLVQLKKVGFRVKADRHQLCIECSEVRSDVDAVLASDSDLLEASCLEFLPGYEPSVSETFREWVDTIRSRIHQKLTSRLVPQIESARRRGDWIRAEGIADLCLSLDRYNETAVLARAEAIAMRGGKLRAVSILDDFLAELGSQAELKLPAKLLRKRVMDRIPEQSNLTSSDAHFVGREREMEILTRRFDAVREGHGSAIQLLGEPG